jgi:hemoglobin
MKIKVFVNGVLSSALIISLAGCSGGMGGSSTMKGAMSLFDQLGGMDQIKSLSNNFVGNMATDSRTSKLMASTDKSAMTSKLSDQLCALTGGGCAAPLTEAQITEGAKKVDPAATSAVNDSFSKALSSLSSSPLVKDTMTKVVGPKLGGIVGALL